MLARDVENRGFPFAGNAIQLANALGRSKDIPDRIQSLLCGFQPYKGGNDLLWALNEVANTDKHRMVIPIGQGLARYGASVRGTGYFSMPDPHVWDRAKNEMKLIELGPGATHTYDFGFQFFIAFHDIEFIDGKSVEYVGFVRGAERDKLLGGARALLYPIQYAEAFGLVMVEAMLCGTPIAAMHIRAS